ncbi:MAG: transcriptional repressor [Muribaculaceae bacterium]|nr:transcriptional repressor [Muribaculaceae bacterium]
MPDNQQLSNQQQNTAFVRYLKANSHRCTPERMAIAEAAAKAHALYTADELYAAMEADGYRVSRATVYNTLHLLVKAGIVREHTFDTQCVRYEYIRAGSTTARVFNICNACGRVREIKDPGVMRMLETRRNSTFMMSHCAVYAYGLCGRCRRKMRNNPSTKKQPTTHKQTDHKK